MLQDAQLEGFVADDLHEYVGQLETAAARYGVTTGVVSERTAVALVDEPGDWDGLKWWRLELRTLVDAAPAQAKVALLGPREAWRAEVPKFAAGSCLQSLAFTWGAQWNAAPISALAVMILVVGIAVVSRRSPAAGSR